MEMNILSWNINGIRSWIKKNGTLDFVSRREVDILCLNETRIDESLVDGIKKSFHMFPYQSWACSKRKGYAGVALLSKIPPISSSIGFNLDYDHEGRVITWEFEFFYLIACYFPNSGGNDEYIEYKMKWDLDFRNFLHSIIDKGKQVIWVGDLNIVGGELDCFVTKGKKIKINPLELESFSKFLDVGFIDTFRYLNPNLRKFTWFSNKFPKNRIENKGWRIDYAMVTPGLLSWVENSIIHDSVLGSDHLPIELKLNIP
jgi:exodeoxyribonuclease III